MKFLLMLVCLLANTVCSAQGRAEYKIVTASEKGTYIQIGRDLAKWVADPTGIDLTVLPSKGSAENVSRLRFEPGVRLALVQSDVYQGMLDAAQGGNTSAAQLIRPLRVMLPLYDEEIYFVTRADSPLKFIHELKDQRINVGPVGSGTALSATTLYRLMFGQSLPEGKTTFYTNEEALLKLTSERSIDVAVIVAGQPAKLFVDMKPEARNYIKFLRLDNKAQETARVTKTYFPATIRQTSYPKWIQEDIPTLSVKAFLVTYDYDTQKTRRQMIRFSKGLCENFKALQTYGHPKWKQVKLDLPALGRGWSYYRPTEKILRSCSSASVLERGNGASRPLRACDQQERILGLCGG